MLAISKIRQRLSTTRNLKLKGLVVSLLCLSIFLTFIDVRATASPLIGHAAYSQTPTTTRVCSPTNGGSVQVTTLTVTIPTGNEFYFSPIFFSGAFNVSSSTNPTYTVTFNITGANARSSVYGFLPSSGVPITQSYQEPVSTSGSYFFYQGHTGTWVWSVYMNTASGQSVCVTEFYTSIEWAYS